MLGHKSATLTLDVYGHLFPDRLDEVSKKMHKRRAMILARGRATGLTTAGLPLDVVPPLPSGGGVNGCTPGHG
ncbi:hypothetical protein [Streptomyces sp. NPDC008317]|uniref:hypothetical protein n=1 Tax=unclassified Streptomyces TaxID=2593676 RepID=UPI0036E767F8